MKYVPLSPELTEKYANIMRKGNPILKRWHAVVAQKLERKYNRTQFRVDLLKQDPDCNANVHGVNIPQRDVEAIFAVKAIENAIYLNNSHLIAKIAKNFSKKMPHIDFNDFHQEGSFALLGAIYGFDHPEIKFSTYATYCVQRRMMNFANEIRPLGKWTNTEINLYRNFTKQQGDLSFDEAVEVADLTEKQKSALSKMMVNVYRQSELSKDDEEDDYSVNAKKVVENKDEPPMFTEKQKKLFNEVGNDLEGWDAIVWKAYCESGGKKGWQSRISENTINPRTGQSYSRQASLLAFDRIRSKILSLYEKEADNEDED